jgi:hypothetical protein
MPCSGIDTGCRVGSPRAELSSGAEEIGDYASSESAIARCESCLAFDDCSVDP